MAWRVANLTGEHKVGKSLATQISSNLLVRTSVVTILIVGFLGVASGVLPVHCLIGTSCGPVSSKPVAQIVPPGSTPVAAEARAPEIAIATPVIQKSAPSLTNNDVLAATFAQLKVELTPPTALTTPTPSAPTRGAKLSTPAPSTQVASTTSSDTGLTTHIVKAISIKPDGTPILGDQVAVGYAEPSSALAPVPSPAVDAAARIGAGQMPVAEAIPVPVVPKPKAPATTTASTGAGNATVLGAGANVRSNPSKSGGKVVFALAGGETVTVIDSQRGWLRVRDDQGRTGWIYADGVKRG